MKISFEVSPVKNKDQCKMTHNNVKMKKFKNIVYRLVKAQKKPQTD